MGRSGPGPGTGAPQRICLYILIPFLCVAGGARCVLGWYRPSAGVPGAGCVRKKFQSDSFSLYVLEDLYVFANRGLISSQRASWRRTCSVPSALCA